VSRIYKDELWPYYGLTDDLHVEAVEVCGRRVWHWRRVLREFRQVQREMADVYEKEPRQ